MQGESKGVSSSNALSNDLSVLHQSGRYWVLKWPLEEVDFRSQLWPADLQKLNWCDGHKNDQPGRSLRFGKWREWQSQKMKLGSTKLAKEQHLALHPTISSNYFFFVLHNLWRFNFCWRFLSFVSRSLIGGFNNLSNLVFKRSRNATKKIKQSVKAAKKEISKEGIRWTTHLFSPESSLAVITWAPCARTKKSPWLTRACDLHVIVSKSRQHFAN